MKNILVRRTINNLLHDQKIQISGDVVSELGDFVERIIVSAIDDMKNEDHNTKRVDGETLIAYIIKNIKQRSNGGGKACQKCAGIKDVWIKTARQLQTLVTDEAKIALMALERNEKYVK